MLGAVFWDVCVIIPDIVRTLRTTALIRNLSITSANSIERHCRMTLMPGSEDVTAFCSGRCGRTHVLAETGIADSTRSRELFDENKRAVAMNSVPPRKSTRCGMGGELARSKSRRPMHFRAWHWCCRTRAVFTMHRAAGRLSSCAPICRAVTRKQPCASTI